MEVKKVNELMKSIIVGIVLIIVSAAGSSFVTITTVNVKIETLKEHFSYVAKDLTKSIDRNYDEINMVDDKVRRIELYKSVNVAAN